MATDKALATTTKSLTIIGQTFRHAEAFAKVLQVLFLSDEMWPECVHTPLPCTAHPRGPACSLLQRSVYRYTLWQLHTVPLKVLCIEQKKILQPLQLDFVSSKALQPLIVHVVRALAACISAVRCRVLPWCATCSTLVCLTSGLPKNVVCVRDYEKRTSKCLQHTLHAVIILHACHTSNHLVVSSNCTSHVTCSPASLNTV